MSKKHHKKLKSKLSNNPSKNNIINFNRKVWGNIWNIIVAISVLVSLFILWPRLTINLGEVVDRTNPFYSSFRLSNDGYVPIKNIRFKCEMKKVSLKDNSSFTNCSFTFSNYFIQSLNTSESTTIRFDNFFNKNMSVSFARIEVVVSYNPFIFPLLFKKVQQFETLQDSNGELFWVPVAVSLKERNNLIKFNERQ